MTTQSDDISNISYKYTVESELKLSFLHLVCTKIEVNMTKSGDQVFTRQCSYTNSVKWG